MHHTIQIQQALHPVRIIKHPRARRMILRVTARGEIRVHIPRSISYHRALAWVSTKRVWLEQQLAQLDSTLVESSFRARRRYIMHRSAANRLVKELVCTVNSRYNFIYNKITIRNQSSRWGSCSRSGNLSFNYKIVFLTPELQVYIVAHELCHLQEMNHSARFWKLVSTVLPNYAHLRAQLRKIRLS